ncbi:PEP-CTERM sorting domain-containing protein [Muricoccus radiodurans]|uniref:Npun_F0296 family exosortase-dependent surface protein n=1 Tax=Muricoccus radiodurans TaxID=2231721 RepID=UPI003CF0FA90
MIQNINVHGLMVANVSGAAPGSTGCRNSIEGKTMLRKALLGGVFASLAFAGGAQAAAIILGATTGGGPLAGSTRENFDGLAANGGTTATGIDVSFTPDGAAVTGSSSGFYAAPFLSGNNGDGFGAGGSNQALGVDATTYLTSGNTSNNGGNGGTATLAFSMSQAYFGILWGSVDTYNTLTFLNDGIVTGTITGSDVINPANGNQGLGGTAYVNIYVQGGYDQVVLTSTQYAFEVDNVAYAVPEPTTLALFGAGLLGLGLARRRRSKASEQAVA